MRIKKRGKAMFNKQKNRSRRVIRICLLAAVWGVCLLALVPASWSQETAEWKLRVSVENASVRLKPAPESPAIATLPKSTVLNSYEAEGAWFRIVFTPGKGGVTLIGYVATNDVEILEQKIKKAVDFWETEKEGFKGLGLNVILFAGWAMIPNGDIGDGTKGLYSLGADAIAARGVDILQRNVKPLRSAVNMGGDIIYDLGRTIGIGIGFGYIQTIQNNTFRYSELEIYEYTMNSVTNLTLTTFRLGVFYALPLSRLFKLRLNAGPALFRVNLDYNRNGAGLDFNENYSINGKSTNLGFQGGLTLETRFLERVSLFLKVQGRAVKMTNLKGLDFLERIEGGLGIPKVENAGTLYFVPGSPYSRLAVYPEGSSDALGARKAVLDFTGADILAGFLVKF
jgi:hypothetical protein